ncbi:unnamed protein product, partial [Coregonus sp. 'balchen']
MCSNVGQCSSHRSMSPSGTLWCPGHAPKQIQHLPFLQSSKLALDIFRVMRALGSRAFL